MNKLLALSIAASSLLALTGCGTCYGGYARGGYYQPTTATYAAPAPYVQTTYVAPAPTVYAAPAPTYYAAPAPTYYAAPAPTYYAPTNYVQTSVAVPRPMFQGSINVHIP